MNDLLRLLLGRLVMNHVVARTMLNPTTNGTVMLKSNRAMEARNEMMVLKLVAKPFMMLSAYLMTTGVTNLHEIAQAHPAKFLNKFQNNPHDDADVEFPEKNTETRAGSKENKESWTLRPTCRGEILER